MAERERRVLAIDPGRGKCGLAVVSASGEIAEQIVVPRADFLKVATDLVERFQPVAVVIGNRTGSAECRGDISPLVDLPVVAVDEHETTLRARDRYFQDHPPRGWRRLAPRGLLSPHRPIDDYAAILLGEKYWKLHAR